MPRAYKFKDEFTALEFLDDLGEVAIDHIARALWVPHDHLDSRSLAAVDYLVSQGFVPVRGTPQEFAKKANRAMRGSCDV